MKPEQIKENFEEQLKSANEQIEKLQAEIAKLSEYRIKLIGGLETLQLMEEKEEEVTEATTEVVSE
jgi:hypothetical protein